MDLVCVTSEIMKVLNNSLDLNKAISPTEMTDISDPGDQQCQSPRHVTLIGLSILLLDRSTGCEVVSKYFNNVLIYTRIHVL